MKTQISYILIKYLIKLLWLRLKAMKRKVYITWTYPRKPKGLTSSGCDNAIHTPLMYDNIFLPVIVAISISKNSNHFYFHN